MKPKYKVGQQLFFVYDYKILKVKIIEAIVRYTQTEKFVEYTFEFKKPAGKVGQKCMKECYFVDNFSVAKAAAKMNAENIAKKLLSQFENLTEMDLEVEENETN